MTNIGDLNGDGTIDLAVGSIDFHTAGDVYILFMNPDGTVQSWNVIGNGAGDSPDDLRASFGASVANLGDLDHDGVTDLLVGAPQWTPDLALSRSGAAYVLFMNPDGTYHRFTRIAQGAGMPVSDDDRFGQSVANLGDLDGDGVTDIAVGAIRDDDGGNNNGSVYIVLLNSDGTAKAYSQITHGIGGGPATFYFGRSIAVIEDGDGNGMPELLVSGSDGAYRLHLAPAVTDYPDATNKLPPSHTLDSQVFLGAAIDVETRLLPNADSTSDDNSAPINDDNGLLDRSQISAFIAVRSRDRGRPGNEHLQRAGHGVRLD